MPSSSAFYQLSSAFQAAPWSDGAALLVSAALFIAYHVFLRLRLSHNPSYTMQAVNRAARSAWVEHIMADEARAILAVQTLRNSTMAATFLASTAVLLIIGTLNLSSQAERLSQWWPGPDPGTSVLPGLLRIKVLFLVADFFAAFFSFAISVRFYNHVGYQITNPANRTSGGFTAQGVAASLNRAGRFYTGGMRAYYLAVPLVFWLFGPVFMLSAMLAVIYVLYRLDRAPSP